MCSVGNVDKEYAMLTLVDAITCVVAPGFRLETCTLNVAPSAVWGEILSLQSRRIRHPAQ